MKSVGIKVGVGKVAGKPMKQRSLFARLRGWLMRKTQGEDQLCPKVAARIEQSKKDWREGRKEHFSPPLTDAADIDKWLDTRL